MEVAASSIPIQVQMAAISLTPKLEQLCPAVAMEMQGPQRGMERAPMGPTQGPRTQSSKMRLERSSVAQEAEHQVMDQVAGVAAE